MTPFVVLQLDPSETRRLVEEHEFYVSQANSRLLGQFKDIESEANQWVEEWIKETAPHFNPDHDDPAQPYEEGAEYYRLLVELRNTTRLSIISAFYHSWDKALRELLVRELSKGPGGKETKEAIWSANFYGIFELLDCLKLIQRQDEICDHLLRCNLVVNVYKHGDGTSLNRLDNEFPEFFDRPLQEGSLAAFAGRSHTQMMVTDQHLQVFSNAIVSFWNALPRQVLSNDIERFPTWLEKALTAD